MMIADADAREAALDPRRSFIVQAPAGSGKTELLVRRYLRLLETVQKPEEVVAITFTIKAAAEMRKRVLEKIPNAGALAHRLKIQTIDAFCAALTRRMPVLSGFGAQPGVVEDAGEHYAEAALRAIMELTPAAARLLAHLDNNVEAATGLVATMLAKRDQWLRKTGAAPTRAQLESALAAERVRLVARARALHRQASPEFAAAALTQNHTWRARGNPVRLEEQTPALREALEWLQRMPGERYSDEQWQTLGAILELLPRAAAHLKLVFAERGETDFTEVAQGAVRALGTPQEPTDLLLALDSRLRHILVDEFQDTSYSQFELLQKLTSGWEPGDGRTLFLVGDPMQSIYRFREANVALFLRAWDEGLGGVALERLSLSTNFRSQAGLVGWYNAAFPHVLAPAADPGSGAVPYSPATPHHERLAGSAVLWHQLADRRSEAARIVELVRAAEGTKAILVRNRSALAEIIPALKAAGIRYRAIEIEHLGEKQVVQDLYALTRALLHLGDRIAWLSLLRAPWLALPLDKLLEIASRPHGKRVDKPLASRPPDKGADKPLASRPHGKGVDKPLASRPPDKGGRGVIWEAIKDDLFLSHFTRILAPAIANRGRGSLRERVEGVWLALGGPACVADKTELEDAERYLDELEALEAAGPITRLAELEAALERLYALPDVEATDEDLQIMTIHKAKGLEFGTVIVPGLDLGPGGGDPDLLLFHEPAEGGLLLAPIKATGAESDPTYRYLARLEVEAEDMEASRLLYVAATRAEKRLHLLACLGCDKDGELKRPAAHTLLSRAWTVAEPHFRPELAALGEASPAAPTNGGTVHRLPADFHLPPLPPAVRWTPPPELMTEGEIEFSWVGETARHVGSVVHRWLQRIAEDELHGWDAKRIDTLAGAFRRELQRRGVRAAESYSAAELVRTALKNTLGDERGRWILARHASSASEVRVRVVSPSGGRTLVVDRVFTDADGARWIVDFKTSRHEGAGLEEFLDEQRRRYEPQLNAYAAALGGAKLGLYFPLLRGWREWTI